MPFFAFAKPILSTAAALCIAGGSLELVTVVTTTQPCAAPPTLLATAHALAPGSEARVVSPEERRAFYRTGGKEFVGRTVHLHVEAEIVRKEPSEFTDRAGGEWVRFENRDVPLLIPARSPYWLQVKRHREGAKEFCVHGRVRLLPGDERERAGIEVTKLVRAPGSWR